VDVTRFSRDRPSADVDGSTEKLRLDLELVERPANVRLQLIIQNEARDHCVIG
jgi:hypothetical protein